MHITAVLRMGVTHDDTGRWGDGREMQEAFDG
jgi:hypothetical protein